MSELFIIPDNVIYILQQCETKLGYFNWKKYKIISTPVIEDFLSKYTPKLNPKFLFNIWKHKLQYIPQCPICGKYNEHFYEGRIFCSSKCFGEYQKVWYKNFCMEKYGVENYFQTEECKQKSKITCNKKYGVDSFSKTDTFSKLYKETCLKRYGVENVFQSESIKQKIKKTNLEKYGFENASQNKEIKNKIKQTNLIHNGVEYPSQNPEISRKMIETRIRKYGTSVCSRKFLNTSNKEKELLDYIKSIYNGLILENVRTVIPNRELDIYIPELNLAIEFNGIYWHSDVYKEYNYHIDKTNMCKERGIKLIHIFEYEWDTKKEICKSIISSNINTNTNIIQGTYCIIKPISTSLYKEFVYTNCITSYTPCKIKIGMFYNNELVSVLGLKKEVDSYKICACCCKTFTKVTSHIKLFLQYINISHLIAIIDLSKFNGNTFKENNFIYNNYINPSFTKFNNYKIYNCGYEKIVYFKEN